MRRAWLSVLAVALVAAACAGLQLGREFPSPDTAQIKVNVTDKAGLLAFFGEPYQVGIDSGDQTWRWFYAQRSTSSTSTRKPLRVSTSMFPPISRIKSRRSLNQM